jgi:hypothetical protein
MLHVFRAYHVHSHEPFLSSRSAVKESSFPSKRVLHHHLRGTSFPFEGVAVAVGAGSRGADSTDDHQPDGRQKLTSLPKGLDIGARAGLVVAVGASLVAGVGARAGAGVSARVVLGVVEPASVVASAGFCVAVHWPSDRILGWTCAT